MGAIAVDLGGTFLRSAIVSDSGELGATKQTRLRTVFDGEQPDAIWLTVAKALADASDAAQADLRPNDPMIIAFPGPIEGESRILAAPTLTGASAVPLGFIERVSARVRRPVRVVNDIAAAALYIATGSNEQRFAVVTVSSGIGSRIFVRGGPITGPAYTGEIGHLAVDYSESATACDCGGRGHLGAIASGRAVERRARSMVTKDPSGFARSLCATRFGATQHNLTNEAHVIPATLADDAWACAIVRHSVAPLAQVLFTMIVAAGLERVYIIGGFATALGARYGLFLSDALDLLDDSPTTAFPIHDLVRVRASGEEPCLRGAAMLA